MDWDKNKSAQKRQDEKCRFNFGWRRRILGVKIFHCPRGRRTKAGQIQILLGVHSRNRAVDTGGGPVHVDPLKALFGLQKSVDLVHSCRAGRQRNDKVVREWLQQVS